MEIKYTLNSEDYLNHQLYLASQSSRINTNRKKSWLITTLAFTFLAVLFYQQHMFDLMYYFLFFTIISGLFFPYYTRKRYKKHYKNFIEENYKTRFNEEIYINIKEDELLTKDRFSEGRMSLSELSEIVEAPTAFYLKTSIAHSLIIPKSALNQPYELKKQLTSISNKFQIPYSNAKNWHWK